MQKKFGTVSIIGQSNVGKSTIINSIIGEKVSIVTRKPQTTRISVTGIFSTNNTQLLFLDNPGIFRTKNTLDKLMIKQAWSSITTADIVLLVIDAGISLNDIVKGIIKKLISTKNYNPNIYIIINKIDKKNTEKNINYLKKEIYILIPKIKIFLLSAKTGKGINKVKKYLIRHAPKGEWRYSEDEYTTLSQRFLAEEITREQLFMQLNQELPYNLKVSTEKWSQNHKTTHISQLITINNINYKKIILGCKGAKIKSIGTKARNIIDRSLNIKCHLSLFVKVQENWIETLDHLKLCNIKT